MEGTPEQPIKALLIVSKNICPHSKPISRLSGAEITEALAMSDKPKKSEMKAILFYIKGSKNQHDCSSSSLCCAMPGYPGEVIRACRREPGAGETLSWRPKERRVHRIKDELSRAPSLQPQAMQGG